MLGCRLANAERELRNYEHRRGIIYNAGSTKYRQDRTEW